MSLLSAFVRNVTYPLYQARRGTHGSLSALRRIRSQRFDRAAVEDMRERQRKLLVDALQYAFDHSPWYAEKFSGAGASREDLAKEGALANLPVITRAELRENMGRVISGEYSRSDLRSAKTGGSTMEPLMFYRDLAVLNYRIAIELFLNEEAGWRIGEPWVNVWGHLDDIPTDDMMKRSKFLIYNDLSRREIACNATYLDEERLTDLIQRIQLKRPTWIFGYPRGIAELARFVIDQKIDLPPVRGVLTTAEPLTLEDQQSMEECFGVSPLDRYASRELGMVSQECAAHCGLHVMTDNVFVEYLKHDPSVADSDAPCRLVITDLRNRGMPLIRYETDDVADPIGDFGSSDCDCRLSGTPLMSHVAGRITDMFIRNDGSLFTGLDVPGMRMAETGWVNQIQYVQTDIDELTVNIVRGENYNPDVIPYLQGQVDTVFKSAVKLNPVFVEKIEKTRSGKYMYSINRVPGERLASFKRTVPESSTGSVSGDPVTPPQGFHPPGR